jgi:hypothetical protein
MLHVSSRPWLTASLLCGCRTLRFLKGAGLASTSSTSHRKWLAASFVCLAVTFLFVAASAASKHTQTADSLDRLIPRDQWASAGLDKLTSAEQQTLANDISSLVATPHPAQQTSAPPAKDHTQWRKLQRKMTKDDVRKLLGEPDTISVSRFSESWYYVAGSVTFNGKGHLDMWTED